MNILSIQSWVAYGHVGNAASMFPLQRLGAEVWGVHTVQFSNHPGYGDHAGTVFAPDTIGALIHGIARRGVLGACDAVLSGYVGNALTGEAIANAAAMVKAANPLGIWCCDPVMGDGDLHSGEGPGLYVRPDIPDFFRDRAVPQCDILTPNHFELQLLAGQPCTTLAATKMAAANLQARMPATGPRIVLVTSLAVEDTPPDQTDLLVSTAGGTFSRLRTPKLAFTGNGAGDAIAGLFLFHYLHEGDAVRAMAQAASAVHGVIRRTVEAGSRELLTVAAQDEFVAPRTMFAAEPC